MFEGFTTSGIVGYKGVRTAAGLDRWNVPSGVRCPPGCARILLFPLLWRLRAASCVRKRSSTCMNRYRFIKETSNVRGFEKGFDSTISIICI
jgi:hypothetical protein